jgi:hypothetical protein
MSTKYELYRAVVHTITDDDVVFVRIPALTGSSIVAVEQLDDDIDFVNPPVGRRVFVAVSTDRTSVCWVTGPEVSP